MSDHISGPRALADPIADITDVYAFPSPGAAGAARAGAEHAAVRAAVRARSPTASSTASACARSPPRAATEPAPFAVGDAEFVFDCVFSDPRQATAPHGAGGHVHDPGGRGRPFRVDDERGGSGHGVRAFAGPRWDPFIMDAPAALKTIATGQLAFTDPARSTWTARTCSASWSRSTARSCSGVPSWSGSSRRR